MRGHLLLLLILAPVLLLAQAPVDATAGTNLTLIRLQSESEVPLSLAQEAEMTIDRAQRWLSAQPPPTDPNEHLLYRYARLPARAPLILKQCELARLEATLPPPPDAHTTTNLTAAIEASQSSPKALFALQCHLPQLNPPSDWRETLVKVFVNTQKVTPTGGYWKNQSETVWAILALRALLNDSSPIQVED